MKKIILCLVMLVLVVTFLFSKGTRESSGFTTKTIKFRLADNNPTSNPLCEANLKFAEYVKEATNGLVEIEVYPDAQLGGESEVVEQVKAGMLDFARINVVQLVQFVGDYQLYNLPYIFDSDEQRWDVTDGEIGQEMAKKLYDKTAIINLGFLDSGWRCFYTTKKPITCLADMKGMKIRVMNSEANIAMVRALGAVPTPMAYSDVFSAMQTGVVDGAENDYVSYQTAGHSEIAKNYTLDRHTAGFGILIMSDKAKRQLTDEQYQIIVDCANKAIAWQRDAMIAQEDKSKDSVVREGTKIWEVDTKEFQNAVISMYDQYPDLKSLIEKVNALR